MCILDEQPDIFRRLFLVNDVPGTEIMRGYVTTILRKDNFDDNAEYFHRALFETGLDLVFCWCAIKNWDFDTTKQTYERICDERNLPRNTFYEEDTTSACTVF